jgi:hypothetical protein
MRFGRMFNRGFRTLGILAAFVLVAAPLSYGDPITFDFYTPTPNYPGIGAPLTFTQDGITITATAWGNTIPGTGNENRMAAGRLTQGGSGLGVCDASENFNCDIYTDNIGANNWILFTFSEQVDPLSLRLYVGSRPDWDISYRLGNITNPDLTGLSYIDPDDLTAVGFAGWQYAASGANTYPITVPVGSLTSANALLIGAKPTNVPPIDDPPDEDDGFKITSMTLNAVPEPTSLVLLGSCFAAISAMSAYRKRKE